MGFCCCSSLTFEETLDIARKKIENARTETPTKKQLQLSNDAKKTIIKAEKILDKEKRANDEVAKFGIASAYHEHSLLLFGLKLSDQAQESHALAIKWGYLHAENPTRPSLCPLLPPGSNIPPSDSGNHISLIKKIFSQNIIPPVAKYPLPAFGGRLSATTQLTYCLSLLSTETSFDIKRDQVELQWCQSTIKEQIECERLNLLATDVIRAFIRDELKQSAAVNEVVCLAPVLGRDEFRRLLHTFVDGIHRSTLQDDVLLNGLAQLIRNSSLDNFDVDDLLKILVLLSDSLQRTNSQSRYNYQLAHTISRVLDSIMDSQIGSLSRDRIHAPLLDYLKGLQDSSDPYLVFQAAYAIQALVYIGDDETKVQAMLRRSGKVVKGISGIVSAVKAIDFNSFIEGLESIQEGLAGASVAYDALVSAYGNAVALANSGKDFYDCIKEAFNFDSGSVWYPALRGLDSLIQEGRFADFEKLIREAPCHMHPAYQWGVCQRLGEIANNPLWDINTRRCAVKFLVEMYEDDTTWGAQVNIKQWILHILTQLENSPDEDIAGHVGVVLPDLAKSGDSGKQELFRARLRNPPRSYPLVAAFQPKKFPLLDIVQDIPNVELAISQLKLERLKDRDANVYISPKGMFSLKATTEFDLMPKVHESLNSGKKVFLLRGGSGSGKSAFNRALEIELWDKYKAGGAIPLFIELPTVENPKQGLIDKQLRQASFSKILVEELKRTKREFVLICDGYDESQLMANLYVANRLNQSGEWAAQMVITCRTEYRSNDYKDLFQPSDPNSIGDSSLFQEAVIAPFSEEQIQEYIDRYVPQENSKWDSRGFGKMLKGIPDLQDLAKNPFVLKLSIEVLPQIVDSNNDLSSKRVTRVELIDKFVALWLERSKKRLLNMRLAPKDDVEFRRLVDEGFPGHGVNFIRDLAVAMYSNQGGFPLVSYAGVREKEDWKKPFFSNVNGNNLLRESIPLSNSGDHYQFIHKPYLEYGLSLAVFDPSVDLPQETKPHSAFIRRMDTVSSAKFGRSSSIEKIITPAERKLLDSPLGTMYLAGNPSTTDCLEFLVERAHKHLSFRANLLEIIEHSKTDEDVRMAAANAITILVKAGIDFNGHNLQNIKIPRADLSYGMFDSAQLDGADLRQVNLRNIWLRGSSLSNTMMKGVQFGESPYIQEVTEVQSCVYSPDGSRFAVILTDGIINIYDMTSWKKIQTLKKDGMEVLGVVFSPDGTHITFGTFTFGTSSEENIVWLYEVATGSEVHAFKGHTDRITCVAFSPNEDRIASGSQDNTVRLWDVNTGESIQLEGHKECITTIAYSPNGDQIASSSDDYTVRLWDVASGECLHILQDDTNFSVTSVVYSPNGEQIASVNYDKTVQLWDVESGECIHTLHGHTDTLTGVAYSPDGVHIASASEDSTVRLWEVETGKCLHVLQGHTGHVTNVVYSPRGDQLATGGLDKTVRLWHFETGDCIQILRGHSDGVTSLMYSPKGDRIASGNSGKSVRVWNVDTGLSVHTTDSHSSEVQAVALSSKGDQIASGSNDHTVRTWDVKTGHCIRTLIGHMESVVSVKYSPNGDLIASASHDDTVRLWDAKTGNSAHKLEHDDRVTCIAFAPNGKHIASGSLDKTVRLWDVKTGQCDHTLFDRDRATGIVGVMYSPDGHHIASFSDDMTVRLWSVKTGTCEHILEGHLDIVLSFAYSLSDNTIASGSQDKTVRLWDNKTGKCTGAFEGHKDAITSVVYSPKQGNIVASGSKDKTVRLWEVKTSTCIHVLEGHEDSVSSIIFSPNGKLIVTGSDDGTFRLWDVESGKCKATVASWNGKVRCLTLKEKKDKKDDLILVAGGEDGSVRLWQITKDGTEHKAILSWSSSHEVLNVSDASFANAKDITLLDQMLLEQRGASL